MAGEAAEVLWDEIPDADMPVCRTKEHFDPQKWNKKLHWRVEN